MGVTEFPCPRCGTPQKVRAPNGQEVRQTLCAACAEQEEKDQKAEPRDHGEEAHQLAKDDQKAKARAR